MRRTVLLYGVLAGGLIFALSYIVIALAGDFSSATPDDVAAIEWFGYSRYLLLALGVIMAMHSYRKNTAGPISYLRAFSLGILVAVVAAVFVGAMEYVYLAYTNPEFYEQYARIMIERMKLDGATMAELEAARKEMADYAWLMNPAATGAFYFVQTAVIGGILSAIAAIFMRRPAGASSAGREVMLNQPA